MLAVAVGTWAVNHFVACLQRIEQRCFKKACLTCFEEGHDEKDCPKRNDSPVASEQTCPVCGGYNMPSFKVGLVVIHVLARAELLKIKYRLVPDSRCSLLHDMFTLSLVRGDGVLMLVYNICHKYVGNRTGGVLPNRAQRSGLFSYVFIM